MVVTDDVGRMGRDQKIQLRELGDVEDIWQKFLLPGDMQGQLRFIDQDEAAFRHIKEQLVEQDQLMLFPEESLSSGSVSPDLVRI